MEIEITSTETLTPSLAVADMSPPDGCRPFNLTATGVECECEAPVCVPSNVSCAALNGEGLESGGCTYSDSMGGLGFDANTWGLISVIGGVFYQSTGPVFTTQFLWLVFGFD